MYFVYGLLAGQLAARGLLSRLMLSVVLWGGLGLAAFKLTEANVSRAAAPYAAVAAPLLLLAWTLHEPAASRTKLRLIEGLVVVATAWAAWTAFKLLLALSASGLRLGALAGYGGSVLKVALLAGLCLGLNLWVERSDRLLGRRSVVSGEVDG